MGPGSRLVAGETHCAEEPGWRRRGCRGSCAPVASAGPRSRLPLSRLRPRRAVQLPAGAQHSPRLGSGPGLHVGARVVQHQRRKHSVELAVGIGQLLGIADTETDSVQLVGFSLCAGRRRTRRQPSRLRLRRYREPRRNHPNTGPPPAVNAQPDVQAPRQCRMALSRPGAYAPVGHPALPP